MNKDERLNKNERNNRRETNDEFLFRSKVQLKCCEVRKTRPFSSIGGKKNVKQQRRISKADRTSRLMISLCSQRKIDANFIDGDGQIKSLESFHDDHLEIRFRHGIRAYFVQKMNFDGDSNLDRTTRETVKMFFQRSYSS
jgi:hypothetical protein